MEKKLCTSTVLVIVLGIVLSGELRACTYSWDTQSEARALEKSLKKLPIESIKGLRKYFLGENKEQEARWSNNAIKIVELAGGLKAIFKTRQYAYAEVAAYNLSQVMGLGLVPPTVLRTIDGEFGSLQLFIPSMGTIEKNLHKVSSKLLSDMQIFYFIAGQWDVHSGNQLVYERDGKICLALIDNAGMLHRQQVIYGHIPFVEKGGGNRRNKPSVNPSKFPFSEGRRLEFTSYSAFSDFMRPFIEKSHREALWLKKKRVPYIIWRDSLWMQIYKYSVSKPAFTSVYYASTLKAAERLNYKLLRTVWEEGYHVDPPHYEDLIKLMLYRRDQLIEAAHSTGTIREG